MFRLPRSAFEAFATFLFMSSMVTAFSPFGVPRPSAQELGKNFVRSTETVKTQRDVGDVLRASAVALVAMVTLGTSPVFADEFGRETEAPTIFTGETVLICTKRGPLGACTQTEARTRENDNDLSDKYFKEPTALVKKKDDEARTAESIEGNALIQRLKQQTEDNREKNELIVQQKTFMNDVSASFGPFDGQVLILNEDGKGFTLLENPQAMRLKKAGFIKDKKFVKQPTQEEIENALQPDGPGFFGSIFGTKE